MPIVSARDFPGRPTRRQGEVVAGAPGARRRPRGRPRPRRGAPERTATQRLNGGPGRGRAIFWVLIIGLVLLLPTLIQFGTLLAENGPAIHVSGGASHLVRSGENLSAIARQHDLTLAELLAVGGNADRFPDPNTIYPGQRVDLR